MGMGRIPALDGLRGVAILLVVAAHAHLIPAIAGKNGVAVFFVLSGFLITRVLLAEEPIRLRRFYLRRARRLLPALIVLVVVAWVAGWISGFDMLWPVTYTTNFALARGYGHFPLSHTWTLAIEEHFYLAWPVALVAIRRSWRAGVVLCGLAAIWSVWATMTADSHFTYQWSTDSHAFMLLAGCAVALGQHHHVLRRTGPTVALIALGGIVAVSFLPDVAMNFNVDRGWGTKALPALLAVLVVNADRVPVLEGKLLGWFGTISYGWYLWHVPLTYFIEPRLVAVTIGLGAAALSWYFVEQPILRGVTGPSRRRELSLPNRPADGSTRRNEIASR